MKTKNLTSCSDHLSNYLFNQELLPIQQSSGSQLVDGATFIAEKDKTHFAAILLLLEEKV